jgi:hypothetical protein
MNWIWWSCSLVLKISSVSSSRMMSHKNLKMFTMLFSIFLALSGLIDHVSL